MQENNNKWLKIIKIIAIVITILCPILLLAKPFLKIGEKIQKLKRKN